MAVKKKGILPFEGICPRTLVLNLRCTLESPRGDFSKIQIPGLHTRDFGLTGLLRGLVLLILF